MGMDMEAFERYLEFVPARHRVWELRQQGAAAPWAEDPILRTKKFTNVYRVLDYGSQFVLSDLYDEGMTAEDLVLRLFLYRHTGVVTAWEYLPLAVGEYPTRDNLEETFEAWEEYREATRTMKVKKGGRYAGQETLHIESKRPVFTSAYLVHPGPAGPETIGTDKLEMIMNLTRRLFLEEGLAEAFLSADTQSARFQTLRKNKGVGDFMSMQILTDYGYTPLGGDTENDFVVPGPGCRKGVSFISDTRDVVGFLKYARSEILAGDDCPMLSLPGGGSRPPSLMDIQNTMCEFSKYERYLKRGTSGKEYRPAHPGVQPEPLLPSNWVATTEGTELL